MSIDNPPPPPKGVIKFDLSPHIVVKFKNSIQLFADNVVKLARLLQPSILFIDGAHNPFIKKVDPLMAANDPRLLGAQLKRILRAVKPADRVMLLGTTNEPWNCAMAKLRKTFERILFCPGADYGTTLLAWRTALLRLAGTDRLMDFSALAKVTQQCNIGAMLETVDRVVDLPRRVL